MVLSPPLVYLVSFLVSSLSRLDLLSRLCLSSVLWCGLWSGLWSGAALSSPVGCRFSPHMKNKHTKKITCSCMSIGSPIICLPPHTVRLHAHTMHVRHDRGTDAGSNHICRSHSRSAQRLHSQNYPRCALPPQHERHGHTLVTTTTASSITHRLPGNVHRQHDTTTTPHVSLAHIHRL